MPGNKLRKKLEQSIRFKSCHGMGANENLEHLRAKKPGTRLALGRRDVKAPFWECNDSLSEPQWHESMHEEP